MRNIMKKMKKLLQNSKKVFKTRKKLHLPGKNVYTNVSKQCYNTTKKEDNYMYKAMDIAQYIITKCTSDGSPVSNLQLQKILFFIQGKWMVQKESALFEEDIFAWQFGPVVPNIYYRFCGYGASKILGRYPEIKIDEQTASIIDPIIEEKRELYPWTLVEQTHKKGGAWDQVYQEGKGDHQVIRKDMIKSDFLNDGVLL